MTEKTSCLVIPKLCFEAALFLALVGGASLSRPAFAALPVDDKMGQPADHRHDRVAPVNNKARSLRTSSTSFSQPIAFIENRGQFDSHVRYQIRIHGQTAWLTDNALVFDVVHAKSDRIVAASKPSERSDPSFKRFSFQEQFAGATRPSSVEPVGCRDAKYNFFVGDKSHWRTGIRSCSGVIYHDLWDRIDLKVYSRDGANLEQEFLVHRSADLSQIRVKYAGVDRLSLNNKGILEIRTKAGTLKETAPSFYVPSNPAQQLQGHFKLLSKLEYTFETQMRPSGDLVVDPALLYSTFAGGSGVDVANGVAADSAGNAYVTGATTSADFPITTGAFQPACPVPAKCSAAFAMKYDPAGNLVYATFLGSTSGGDFGQGIAVNSAGEAYVTGIANSGFPHSTDILQGYCFQSAFLAKLNSTGDTLQYSACFGQTGEGSGVATDAAGKAYITGWLNSLPTTANAFQKGNNSTQGSNAFLVVVDPALPGSASLLYSSFIGGSGSDLAFGIAVDSQNNPYICGTAGSANFPTTPGAYQTVNQFNNAFVAKFNPTQSGTASLIYSTFIGGNNVHDFGNVAQDVAFGIAVDAQGSVYVTGAPGFAFPITQGLYGAGKRETFITKLNPGGSALVFSTMLPGTCGSGCNTNGIVVDPSGNSYVTGTANGRFLVTADAFQATFGGDGDAFLAGLSADGATLLYASYLGGPYIDYGSAIALDAVGDVYVAGATASPNFPVTPGNHQLTIGGTDTSACPYAGAGPVCFDAFLTKFPLGAPGGLWFEGLRQTRAEMRVP